ncbi:MAG: ABC transporter ATP-binding protein [Fimbriimonadales bacterium]
MPVVVAERLSRTFITHKKEPGTLGALRSLVTRKKVEVKAVQDVSFGIEEGELVGFLGPNGAGKTTTLKMLTGILYPSSGEASVLGYPPWKRDTRMLRQIALVMGQKMQLWWDLAVYDSLRLYKELYEVSEADFKVRLAELAEALQVTDKLRTQVRRLSLGERMKCELIAALLHRPKVVFLDEPTIGLDLVSQKRIREFLLETNRRDHTTILLTSHYMQDVQALCDRVLIIDHGRLLYDDRLGKLLKSYGSHRLLRLQFDRPVEAEELGRFGRVVRHTEDTADIEVPRAETSQAAAGVLATLPVSDITIAEPSVEDVIAEIFSGGKALPGANQPESDTPGPEES